MKHLKSALLSLLSGGLFGYGLAYSDMLSPDRVRGFFDIFGGWDPTLIFVMIGALSVSLLGHFILEKHPKPFFAEKWHFPWERKGIIDRKLVIGSILFGIGWGLGGLCPGPAVGAIIFHQSFTLIFLVSMLTSMFLTKKFIP